ncbi:hypothetical protein B5F04_08800 [Limosilactobacillus reuteri]|uniref:LAGLIDADG family homing endonuclease n=1 Tax=Limosilactobacillus reuteri TaxID=1598 RepID=UPI000B37FCEC|nr:LAGLIDADG family homing endonuclease [Limosilactobacillus reuteri]OUP87202.1 hypothetical protein B5F04_08800 [Limosilactobacillus reuteri]
MYNVKEAVDLYKSGVSVKELSEKYNYSDTHIRNKLKEQGIKLNGNIVMTKERTFEAVSMYNQGIPVKEIADKMSVSTTSVRDALIREGVYKKKQFFSIPREEWNVVTQKIKDGYTIKELAKEYNTSESAFDNYINKNNINPSKRLLLSEEEKKKIVELHNTGFNTVEIGNKLGRSDSTIGRYLISIGYENEGNSMKKADKQIAFKLYRDGYTNQQIWELKFQGIYNPKTIESHIKKAGLGRKGGNFNPNTVRDYFQQIDTPEKAYVLGYIFADGHVGEKQIRLECIRKDVELLNFVIEQLSPGTKIHEFTKPPRRWKDGHTSSVLETYYCSVGCWEHVRDLKKYNLYHRKQCMDYPLPELDKDLYRDFLRGVFDGDGTTWVQNGTPKVSICFDHNQACEMEEILKEAGVITKPNNNIIDMDKYGSNISHLRITRLKDVKAFFNYIYYDQNLFCLTRKYKKFKNSL